MCKYRIKINRRGVSPVIATLLLVAIAVAASVVTYTWAMSMTANQSQQAQTGIKLDQVFFGNSTTNGGVLIALRNTGSIPATVQSITIFNGSQAMIAYIASANIIVSPSEVKNIGITDGTNWTDLKAGGLSIPSPDSGASITNIDFQDALEPNRPYVIRILTTTGFTAEGTYYTPGSFS